MYATLTIEAIDFEQELIFTPEERYAQLTLYVQQLQLSVESNLSTVVAEFFLGNYLKGDPGTGTTTKIEFTTSDWVSVAGGFELSLQHNLGANVQVTIYESNNEVIVDKNLFNTNTVKLFVPYDFRFNGYAIIKN